MALAEEERRRHAAECVKLANDRARLLYGLMALRVPDDIIKELRAGNVSAFEEWNMQNIK